MEKGCFYLQTFANLGWLHKIDLPRSIDFSVISSKSTLNTEISNKLAVLLKGSFLYTLCYRVDLLFCFVLGFCFHTLSLVLVILCCTYDIYLIILLVCFCVWNHVGLMHLQILRKGKNVLQPSLFSYIWICYSFLCSLEKYSIWYYSFWKLVCFMYLFHIKMVRFGSVFWCFRSLVWSQ